MCICKHLPVEFEIAGKTYKCSNDINSDSYSYYLNGDTNALHFTLATTNNGNKHVSDLEKIHVSIPVDGFNLHVWKRNGILEDNRSRAATFRDKEIQDALDGNLDEVNKILNGIDSQIVCRCPK